MRLIQTGADVSRVRRASFVPDLDPTAHTCCQIDGVGLIDEDRVRVSLNGRPVRDGGGNRIPRSAWTECRLIEHVTLSKHEESS